MAGSEREREGFAPDRVLHEPVRLQIISYLAAGGKQASFTEMKEKLSLTAGNLSVQLKRLEEAGYITINKSIRNRKSLTRVALTRRGMEALWQYLGELEEMIEHLKKSTK
jgi:DNA-binding transcriptional ArsR family regulator